MTVAAAGRTATLRGVRPAATASTPVAEPVADFVPPPALPTPPPPTADSRAGTRGADEEEEVPFFRKVLAHHATEDSGGYGPNWSGVDDYDIPTVLRKQMD